MKVLIVCSGNRADFKFEIHQAFIYDQIKAVNLYYPEIYFETFFINRKGFIGYLKNLSKLIKKLKRNNIDIVHSHFALSSLLANLQRKVPVVSTFHGSDINVKKINYISSFVNVLSIKSVFVSSKLMNKIFIKIPDKSHMVPCGVNMNLFHPSSKLEARNKFNLCPNKKYILFSSSFDNPVKNSQLARKAIHILGNGVELLELKDYSREDVNILLNAADAMLMTSFSEGSPQIIKEAMACNIPIVSVDVGDVKEILADTKRTYICSYDPEDIAEKIQLIINFGKRTNGREKIKHFDNKIIAKKVYNIYKDVLSSK